MKKKSQNLVRIYDGVNLCGGSSCCPVVDYDKYGNQVIISDPAKPEKGAFKMSIEEYNAFIKNAKLIK